METFDMAKKHTRNESARQHFDLSTITTTITTITTMTMITTTTATSATTATTATATTTRTTSTTTATTTTTVEKTGDTHHDIRKPANIYPCTQADKMNVVEQFTELVDMTSVTISNAGWDQTSTLNYATAT